VQLATAFGGSVTGVCSARGMETVRALEANTVIDYTKEDFTQNGERYDLILDVAANRSVSEYRRTLKPGGTCVVIGFSTIRHMLSAGFSAKRDGKKIAILAANNKDGNDLRFLNSLIEGGKVKPVIDSRYTLCEAAEAIRHVEGNHPIGKVVITMG